MFIHAGDQIGRGIAVTRGADCYVIVPQHVMADPVTFRVIGKQRRESAASRGPTNKNWDIGALKIKNPTAVCGKDYYLVAINLSEHLKAKQRVVLHVPQPDGLITEIAAHISGWDDNYITITTEGTGAVLHEGLSGSMLHVAGQLAGMLISVDTAHGNLGTVMRVERMHAAIGNFTPLFPPPQEKARYDDQLAGEILQKNLNFLETQEFCQNLYTMGLWLVKRDTKFEFVERHILNGDYRYAISSIIIPGTNSEMWFTEKNDKVAHISTIIGRVPRTEDPRIIKRRIESSVSRCINGNVFGPIDSLRFRHGPVTLKSSGSISWMFEYTSSWGISLEFIHVILSGYNNSMALHLSAEKY